MGTYDHKQLLSDYTNGRMNVEMVMGHSLQHTEKLYEAQTAANISHYRLKNRVFNLEHEVKILRGEVERLTTTVEKPPLSRKRKRRSWGKPQKDRP